MLMWLSMFLAVACGLAAHCMRNELRALECLVLLHLEQRGESSALEIRDKYDVGRVAVYNVLHDLERQGRVRARKVEGSPERDGRPRRLYRIAGTVPASWKQPTAKATDTSIRCTVCGLTSHNPNDMREGYCGNCRAWTGRPTR